MNKIKVLKGQLREKDKTYTYLTIPLHMSQDPNMFIAKLPSFLRGKIHNTQHLDLIKQMQINTLEACSSQITMIHSGSF